jgi:hypothetical protein
VGWCECARRARSLFSFPAKASHLVIPAEAGIHLLLFLTFRRCRENRLTSLCCSGRHPGGRVTFSACPEKVTKERAPGWSAGCAGSLRAAGVPLTGHPALQRNERDPSRSPALARGPDPAALRRPTRVNVKGPSKCRWIPAFAGMTGLRFGFRCCVASAARTAALCSSRVPSRPRRGRGGKSPQGRAHDARAFAVSTGMCCQRTSVASSRSRRAGARRPRP